ncbi:Calx-beta domain-containing protein [Odoribacter sp. AF15-53]|uniref:Calx-beta domain-containing protein n=1 Tax=Odoribacter sp. AF15-53 TaxID=2292236 RepID=UPI0013144C7A|nr:Calx-beta domain-containing protein [Odoribacter sp. AF15-53]
MQKVLKLVAVFTLIMCFTACSDDDDNARTVSFKRAVYILSSNQAIEVEIGLSEPAGQELVVPFEVFGTAVEGEDYSLSAREFVVAPGENSAKIVITPVDNIYSDRQIRLELGNVVGYEYGNYRVALIPVETKEVITTSFVTDTYELKNFVTVSMNMYIGGSSYKNPSYPVLVPFEIDPSSTAELGIHFEIVGGNQQLVMPIGGTSAQVKLKCLKKEAGKDKIVLRMSDEDLHYLAGERNRTIITIDGPTRFEDLAGIWRMDGFTSLAHVKSSVLSGDESDLEYLPENNPVTDKLIFKTGATNRMDVSQITGDLARYLRDCDLSSVKEEEEYLYEMGDNPPFQSVLTMEMSEANVNYSVTSTKIRKAQIGFRLLDGGNTLELRVFDYEPTDFLQKTYQYRSTSSAFSKEPMKRDFTLVFKFVREN